MRALNTTFLALLLGLTIFACGKNETPPPAAEPAVPATQTMQPAAPAAAPVSAINLGNAIGADKRVTTPNTSFAPKDTVYAAVETQGRGTLTLKAKWTYHKDDKVATVKEDSMTIASSGPAVNEFHISMPTGLPAGDYEVEIFANDKSAGVTKFTVK